ncbi:MAG: UDP-3-O-(3-hydroxymyristoyl)glucosamine N-acyltransferase [Bacteroidetes bacterium]|nr:UDP-3-O-(3-hydroxymyristoyl)glucosamine N-acyltransferase [Bacteroidota bacterium]MCL2303549.1 UDP-3-O-(3-hydroxymyristoyl)glucosamine N-acyltransferase [Lentimicrobiaceae bacterium]
MKFSSKLTVNQIVEIMNAEVTVKGNLNNLISGINEIHSVESGDISFVDHPKYYEKVLNSKAIAVIINKDAEVPEGKTLFICNDPLQCYLNIVHHFVAFTPQHTAIHPSAKIGEGTVIQPNVFIGENVIIGKNCIIHANVSIYADTEIGNNVVIHSNSTIGGDACYFQKRETGWVKLTSCGSTKIEDDVEIGCNCCIDKGVSGVTFIGKGTKFDNQVQIGHDAHVGAHCFLGAQSGVSGCTFVDDHCAIWAKSGVNKGIYVAKNTTILAMSAVDRTITEEGTVLFGLPAEDARKKWREIAYIRNLPELYTEFEKFKKGL